MIFDKPTVLKLPIVLREVEVARVEAVSPTLRRVWFASGQLGPFSRDGRELPAFRSEGPDDHVKFFFPSPIDGVLSLPTQADGTIDWPRDPRPVARDYTPRGYGEGDAEVAFDFVLHGHGVASTWAAMAKPGDKLHMAGPKASLLIPGAHHFVLVGDQTALPAICNWLERLPEGVRADAVIWIEDEASHIEIKTHADANIEWVVDRDPDGAAVLAAVRALPRPDGRSFVWAAMEAGVLRRLRAYYADELGLGRAQLDMTAYWRRGIDDDQILAGAFRLKEMADLEKPYAIRAAVQFRLPDLVAEGVCDIGALARRAGVDIGALRRLMPTFVACDIFKQNGKRLSLGLTGDLLTSPYRRNLFSNGTATGRIHLSAAGMEHFLRTGQSAYGAVFGRGIEEDAQADDTIGAGLGHDLGHMVGNLAGHSLDRMAGLCSAPLLVLGTGADAVLTGLLKSRTDLTGTALVPDYARQEAQDHVEEAGLGTRATVIAPDTPLPAARTLVVSAIGASWSDDLVESALAAQQADEMWLVELAGVPQSPELAEDAMHLNLAFGIRSEDAEGLAGRLAEYGLKRSETLETRTGLRLTRFVIL